MFRSTCPPSSQSWKIESRRVLETLVEPLFVTSRLPHQPLLHFSSAAKCNDAEPSGAGVGVGVGVGVAVAAGVGVGVGVAVGVWGLPSAWVMVVAAEDAGFQ